MSEEYVKISLENYNNIQCELINRNEDIERLTAESTKYESKFYDETKENERLHSIIKEVREYTNKYFVLGGNTYKEKVLEILDKVGDEK